MAGIYLKKEPLPLKKSLSDLDKSNLAPYKVIEKSKIENQDILNTLARVASRADTIASNCNSPAPLR